LTSEIFQFIIASSSTHAWGGKLHKSNIRNAVYSLSFCPCMGREAVTNQTSGMQIIAFSSSHAWGGKLYK
jgi:hypothetical protein